MANDWGGLVDRVVGGGVVVVGIVGLLVVDGLDILRARLL